MRRWGRKGLERSILEEQLLPELYPGKDRVEHVEGGV